MVYLPFMVTIAQRYDPKAGIGTVIALMIPYVWCIIVVWIILFILWFVLGAAARTRLPREDLTPLRA